MTVTTFLDDLNHTYEHLHIAKEDAFWAAYMGLTDDAATARADLTAKEQALQAWLQDPAHLAAVRGQIEAAQGATPEELLALQGWERTFGAHAIDSAEGRALASSIVELEGELANKRGGLKLGYQIPGQEFVPASSVKLAALAADCPDPAIREAAWQGLRSIEEFVLANGFIEILKERNRLGRMLGGEDYYDWKVQRVEGMTKREIFALLDDLEAATRDSARANIDALKQVHGAGLVTGWNIRYLISGDVNAEQDPYFPFAKALERWGRSFAALGIDYNGADLVLDLLDRKGKYENGFMHGPVPAWRDHGVYRPARIQFTANAIPGLVGVGYRATETLFHEGGHAAHFANIDMPSPCFSQEFAPTSVAFAETQSMFCDSLLNDADWQTRYASTLGGEPIPWALIEKAIGCRQPFAAWSIRAMLAVCYGERALYELPEDQLTPEIILKTLREIEQRILFLPDGSPRPILAVPHLLSGESSAYYHGYVLAEMAVAQTRRFFQKRDGHLVDNPKIGPALKAAYWQPGNSRRFPDFIHSLTGERLGATALAEESNRSIEEALAEARGQVAKLPSIAPHEGSVMLGGRIRVMHGNDEIASTQPGTFEEACGQFEQWIEHQLAVPA